ncbi:MAG: tyrosine-type recombinase/integrase, partial [Asgard group archaeon]
IDRVPSNAELKRILSHIPILGKALYLTLVSSGMRIGETLQLELDDINLESDPVEITIRGEYTKSGNWRYAFISKEAKGFLIEWLKERDDYLKTAVKKSTRHKKNTEDNKIFPFEHPTAYSLWNKAVKKAGFFKRDRSTNRHTLHPHVLRKFFRTKMGVVIPVDVVEALIGHEGYLTEVYRRYSKEQLAKFYKEGEYAITIFSEAEQVGELRKEVKEQKENLQRIVNGLTAENIELKQGLKRIEKEQKQEKEELGKTILEMERKFEILMGKIEKLEKTEQ